MDKIKVNLFVNEKEVSVLVDGNARLVDVLREQLSMVSVKEGCGIGECGACTVIANGKSINSCLTLAAAMEGKHLTTTEGLMVEGKLHPI